MGAFGADYGQQIRLEVHGGCSRLPIIKQIMDVARQPNVGVCWNCNGQDLDGEGLEHNFNLVAARFGDTVHVRELNLTDYPYQQLVNLLVATNYDGWILLEGRIMPKDPIKALIEQREVFAQMVAKAQAGGAQPAAGGVKLTQSDDKVTVEINGKLFTEYRFKEPAAAVLLPGDRTDGPAGHAALAGREHRSG